jgi:hypothetical protein
VPGQDVLDSITRERLTAGAYKYRCIGLPVAFPQPSAQSDDDLLAQWNAACFSPFPGATNVSPGFQHYILAAESD